MKNTFRSLAVAACLALMPQITQAAPVVLVVSGGTYPLSVPTFGGTFIPNGDLPTRYTVTLVYDDEAAPLDTSADGTAALFPIMSFTALVGANSPDTTLLSAEPTPTDISFIPGTSTVTLDNATSSYIRLTQNGVGIQFTVQGEAQQSGVASFGIDIPGAFSANPVSVALKDLTTNGSLETLPGGPGRPPPSGSFGFFQTPGSTSSFGTCTAESQQACGLGGLLFPRGELYTLDNPPDPELTAPILLAPVPLPASGLMLAAAVLGLSFGWRRKTRNDAV